MTAAIQPVNTEWDYSNTRVCRRLCSPNLHPLIFEPSSYLACFTCSTWYHPLLPTGDLISVSDADLLLVVVFLYYCCCCNLSCHFWDDQTMWEYNFVWSFVIGRVRCLRSDVIEARGRGDILLLPWCCRRMTFENRLWMMMSDDLYFHHIYYLLHSSHLVLPYGIFEYFWCFDNIYICCMLH